MSKRRQSPQSRPRRRARSGQTAADHQHDHDDQEQEQEPRASRLRRLLAWLKTPVHAIFAAALAIATTVILGAVAGPATKLFCSTFPIGCTQPDAISVVANEDHVKNAKGNPIGGIYVTPKAPSLWSTPPNPSRDDDCVGRYDWAHEKLGAFDAAATVANIDITATGDKQVTVVGFEPEIVRHDPPSWNIIGCAGRGDGGRPAQMVTLDLDTAAVTQLSSTTGGTRFDISPGNSTTYLVTANTVQCDCSWRLVVTLLIDGQTRTETIGPDGARLGTPQQNPDQPTFRTVATSLSTNYRYADGRWITDSAAPKPVLGTACKLLEAAEVKAVFGQTLQPSESAAVATNGPAQQPMQERRCVWEARDGTNMNVVVDQFRSAGAAGTAFAAFFDALKDQKATVQALPQVGDEAKIATADDITYAGARVGSQLLLIEASTSGHAGSATQQPLDEALTVRLLQQAKLRL